MPLEFTPCLDSASIADARRRELDIDRVAATLLGHQAVEAIEHGWYLDDDDLEVNWSNAVARAVAARVSLPPNAPLPSRGAARMEPTRVTVANETTLSAARRLVDAGRRPLALNMANGETPGGGFLHGSRAQEEVACRSSALHATLAGDPMYQVHSQRDDYESSDWVILSPDVPVFRTDDGRALAEPWLCSFITCAAPVAPRVGEPRSAMLMTQRIGRLLEIAAAYGFESLVLGAWGCGAFGNDPAKTAAAFHHHLAGRFDGCFRDVVFAITDWSDERRFLGPFRDEFTPPMPVTGDV